jgi:chloramphenicol 3-O-phosphotransferase
MGNPLDGKIIYKNGGFSMGKSSINDYKWWLFHGKII